MKIGDLVKIDLHLFGHPSMPLKWHLFGRSDDAVTARLGVVTKLYPNTSYLDVTVPSERATVTLVGMEDVEFITGAGTLAEANKKKE